MVVTIAGSAILVGFGVRPAAAAHRTVTAVKGSALGYWSDGISMFGGAQPDRGPTPVADLAADASNSPRNATQASGLVEYRPAVLFTSDRLDVSTSGSLGTNGSATSSSSIQNINKSTTQPNETGAEIFTADMVSSTCTATKAATSGSATITNGVLRVDTGWDDGDLVYPEPAATAGGVDEHDAAFEVISPRPDPGTTHAGHIHLSGTAHDYFTLVFNEHVTKPDGSLTVNAVHEYLGTDPPGNTSALKGHIYLGQSVCGVTTTAGSNVTPVAGDDFYVTGSGTPFTVPTPGILSNDTDPDGGPLTAGSATDPLGGSVTLNADGSFTYTPDAGFSGTDSFTYTVTDDHGATDTATVTVSPDTYLAVGNAWVTEGNSGTTTANFTVTRSGNTAGTSSVKYRTTNGTAAADSDFTGISTNLTLSFAAGEASKVIAVNVTGDTVTEANETFNVVLSAPVGAKVSDTAGVGTIVTDDGDPRTYLSVNDVVVTEGHAGTVTARFTITRSGLTTGATTVSYKTTNGTATAGSDYTAIPLTPVTFAAGETTKTVSVSVSGDTLDEVNETFTVNLSSAGTAVITDATGTATVVDDEGSVTPGPTTFYAVSDVSVTEPNSGTTAATFTITRSGNTASTGSVKYVTANGTAAAPGDYTAKASTVLSFAAGETSKPVTVDVVGDSTPEADETFRLSLSAPIGGVISDYSGTATIFNDEFSYVSISDRSVGEGNAGSTVVRFTLTRSGNTSAAGSVRYATSGGTATAGSDYTAVPSTLVSFAAGETTKVVSVTVTGDTVAEVTETFNVVLSSPTLLMIADTTGVGAIVNDDR